MRHHTEKIFTCSDCGKLIHNDVLCPYCDCTKILVKIIVIETKKPKRRSHENRRLFKQLNLFDQKE